MSKEVENLKDPAAMEVVEKLDSMEEVEKALAPRPLPSFVAKVWPQSKVSEFQELVSGSLSVEIDKLLLTGEICGDLATEYVIMLPEYRDLYRRLHLLARRMVKHLFSSGKMRKPIAETLSTLKLQTGKGVMRYFSSLEKIIMSQVMEGYKVMRNPFLTTFAKHFSQQYALTSYDYIARNYSAEQVNKIYAAFDYLDKAYSSTTVPFVFSGAYKARAHMLEVFERNEEYVSLFTSDTEETESLSDDELEDYINLLQGDVISLSVYRKIDDFSKDFGEVAIEYYLPEGCEDDDSWSLASVGIACINFGVGEDRRDPRIDKVYDFAQMMGIDGLSDFHEMVENHQSENSQRRAYFERDNGGKKGGVQYFTNPMMVEIVIDRLSGNLIFPCSTFSLENSMNRRDYLLLKYRIFSDLLEHLEGKEDDREFIYAESDIGFKTTHYKKSVKKVAENVLDDPEDNSFEPTWVWTGYDDSSNKGLLDLDEEAGDKVPDLGNEPEKLRLPHSFKGREVLAALKRDLEFIRSTGSHHVFRGPSGVKFPIPIHGNAEVPTGTLITCLRMWGLPRDYVRRI